VVFDDGFFDSENTSHAGLFPDKDSNYVDIKNPLGKLQRNEVQSFTRNPL
jgi:translation elongation factor EF-4